MAGEGEVDDPGVKIWRMSLGARLILRLTAFCGGSGGRGWFLCLTGVGGWGRIVMQDITKG